MSGIEKKAIFKKLNLDRAALAVFLIAMVLRLAWVGFDHAKHPVEGSARVGDDFEYIAVAENLLSGRGWWSPDAGGQIYHHGPVFPLFVAGVLALGGSLVTVTLVNAFIGALTCWGVVRVGRRMSSGEGAVLAGLTMAVYPYLLYYTGKVLIETLAVFFGLLLFATLLRFSRSPNYRNAALTGVILGLATLNHPETYIAPPLLILWILIAQPERARVMKGLAVLFIVFGLTLLPWHAYHAIRSGKNIFLPPGLGAGGVLAQATLEAKGRIEGDPKYFEETADRLEQEGSALEQSHGNARGVAVATEKVLQDFMTDPGEYLQFVALKCWRMWGLAPERGAYARPWVTIPTGALNAVLYTGFLAGLFMYRPRQEAVLALTLVVIYTLPHLFFYAQPRYRLPVMPVVALMAGVAANFAAQRMFGRIPAVAASRVDDNRG